MHFTVDYYKTQNGNCPAKEFLNFLDEKMQARFFRLLYLLEQNGNELAKKYRKEYLERLGKENE